jgi:uncharacterized protein YicC (UPF0701 family)
MISVFVGIGSFFTALVFFLVKSFQGSMRIELMEMNKNLSKLSITFSALDKNVAVMSKIIDFMDEEIKRFRAHIEESEK